MIQKTEQILYEKMVRFCDYRERCSYEIEQKFRDLQAEQPHRSKVLEWLKEGEHFNDELYAESFASGKFRIKGWGKMKIKGALFAKRIPEQLINDALNKIDQEEYIKKAKDLVLRKLGTKKMDHISRQKVIRSMFLKGYDSSLVIDILESLKMEIKEGSV